MSTIRDLADYYVARMASQYQLQAKAPNHVALFAKQLMADALALEISPVFDVDTAQGEQLDIIGKYVGISRDVGVNDTRPFFGFVTYDYPAGTQNPNGFLLYASLTVNTNNIWYEYEFTNQSTSQLPDYSYKQLLQLKIFTNSSNNSMDAIQRQIADFFPRQLQLRDNKDMSLTYFFGSTFQLPLSVLTAALPRPMGVKVTALEAIGFDISIDGTPAFTSETPSPSVNYGQIQFADVRTFQITNARSSLFTVIAIATNNPVFSVESVVPSLPDTLAFGDSMQFVLKASSTESVQNLSALLSIYLTSSAGLARFDIAMQVSIEGVFINWMSFDDFDGYPDGPLPSPNDSWGWELSGSTTQFYPLIITDNFDEYTDGSLPAPNAGSNWSEDGTTVQYSNL